MLVTEEEAKTKWCCVDPQLYCFASACMAWRWEHGDPDFREVNEPARGFCGLVSNPNKEQPR